MSANQGPRTWPRLRRSARRVELTWADQISGLDPHHQLWTADGINEAAIPAALARGEDMSGWVWCLVAVVGVLGAVLFLGLTVSPWAALLLAVVVMSALVGVAVAATRNLKRHRTYGGNRS